MYIGLDYNAVSCISTFLLPHEIIRNGIISKLFHTISQEIKVEIMSIDGYYRHNNVLYHSALSTIPRHNDDLRFIQKNTITLKMTNKNIGIVVCSQNGKQLFVIYNRDLEHEIVRAQWNKVKDYGQCILFDAFIMHYHHVASIPKVFPKEYTVVINDHAIYLSLVSNDKISLSDILEIFSRTDFLDECNNRYLFPYFKDSNVASFRHTRDILIGGFLGSGLSVYGTPNRSEYIEYVDSELKISFADEWNNISNNE